MMQEGRFPTIHTSRCILRKMSIEDAPSLVKHANNKKISDYIINIPYPYDEPQAVFRLSYVVQGFKNKSRFVFAIVLKENKEFIGEISLNLDQHHRAELGYWLGELYWGRGLMTEVITSVLKFGFSNLHLKTIFATCHVENMASSKVLVKNGMKPIQENGNVVLFSLSREE